MRHGACRLCGTSAGAIIAPVAIHTLPQDEPMARVDLRSAFTDRMDPVEAAEHLLDQLGPARPKLVTLYATRDRDQTALNAAVRERLPRDTRLIGATTGGVIDTHGIHFGGVVLGALEGDFEVGLGLGRELARDAVKAGATAMRVACENLGVNPRDLDTSKHVGLVIDDGFKNKKEELLMGALERNQGTLLVGGGAADFGMDPAQHSCRIHVDGEVVDDCVAIAMFRTNAPFAALRHHAYTPVGRTMTITRVSDEGNRALEIDGKPAAPYYADMLGCGIEDLEFLKPTGFGHRPLALKVGREYFMRTPFAPLPDGSILFGNLIEEGAEYELMQLEDMTQRLEHFLSHELPRRVKNPSAALWFHCGGRQWLASGLGQTDALSNAFRGGPPAVGFNVQFEIFCGFFINTTLTSLVFGSDR